MLTKANGFSKMLFKQKARFSVNHILQTEKRLFCLIQNILNLLPRDLKILTLILIGKSTSNPSLKTPNIREDKRRFPPASLFTLEAPSNSFPLQSGFNLESSLIKFFRWPWFRKHEGRHWNVVAADDGWPLPSPASPVLSDQEEEVVNKLNRNRPLLEVLTGFLPTNTPLTRHIAAPSIPTHTPTIEFYRGRFRAKTKSFQNMQGKVTEVCLRSIRVVTSRCWIWFWLLVLNFDLPKFRLKWSLRT